MTYQNKNNPFYKGVPSLFVINAPFQALCCAEAIREFEIEEYEVYILVYENEKRLDQIGRILSHYSIDYKVVPINGYSFISFLLDCLKHKKRYERVFTGDYYCVTFTVFALSRLRFGGNIIYMDDGNSTVTIFKDKLMKSKTGFSFKFIKTLVTVVSFFKKVESGRYFYSVYADIPNSKYIVYRNGLSHLKTIVEANYNTDISFFIGTNPTNFCLDYKIKPDEYKKILFDELSAIKNKTDNCVYIPHGQDHDSETEVFCKEKGIQYIRPAMCVELFMLENYSNIKELYGLSSSALYSLKLLYPESQIFNLLIKTADNNPESGVMAQYYHKHGIINKVCVI